MKIILEIIIFLQQQQLILKKINKIIKNNFICKKHKKQFEGFSINYMDNYCPFCIKIQNKSDSIIYFNDLKQKMKKSNYLKK